MPAIDVFNSDAFSLVSLTDGINKAPYQPGRIGALKLFRESGITTTTVVVEEKDGQLTLIQTSPRGGPGSATGPVRRRARSFVVPHLERESTIMADSIQNVRAFGTESELASIQPVIDERLVELRAMHEVTLEHMRAGAIQGQVLDADGTVLFNLFTEFGVSQQVYVLSLLTSNAALRSEMVAIQRLIEAELGADVATGYRAFCGDEFFDALIEHPVIKATLIDDRLNDQRRDLRQGFEWGGILWENYRGRVGSTDFFPTDEAHVVPTGTINLFRTYFAPADFIETVNTVGLPMYAKQFRDADLNRWAKIHSQSNPLAISLRPRAMVKVTIGT